MRYGQAVGVVHADLIDPAIQAQYPELVAAAEDQKLPFPLVAINGEIRLAGSAHYFRVVPLVEEALQNGT
jgi:hypothetical protein